jgi:hypothetical protein
MNSLPQRITLQDWQERHAALQRQGLREPWYGGELARHVTDGDYRLTTLRFDNSPASLTLWNFLLTEEMRLNRARERGFKIVGAMKDLGTVPLMAYALPNTIAFYPDGAWWVPCIMEQSTRDCSTADALGIDESFCPVRAMLGAFVNNEHFPRPDLLVCSVGATCDDFSAIAQRLESLGHNLLWWEIPPRRQPDRGEEAVALTGPLSQAWHAPRRQVQYVHAELDRIRQAIAACAGRELTDDLLRQSIAQANRVRAVLAELRHLTFTARVAPLPALELLVAEMLAIHFCSDREESYAVLSGLLEEVRRRVAAGTGVLSPEAVRVFWVNPVSDLQAMNLLEESGGRLCGTDFMFTHALDPIPEDADPLWSLARAALSDPMVGPAANRAARICHDARRYGAQAVVISRIPGASHCAWESQILCEQIGRELGLPTVEITVPPIDDAVRGSLATRLEALVETARMRG